MMLTPDIGIKSQLLLSWLKPDILVFLHCVTRMYFGLLMEAVSEHTRYTSVPDLLLI